MRKRNGEVDKWRSRKGDTQIEKERDENNATLK